MIYFIRILLHDPSKFHFSYLQNFRPPSLPFYIHFIPSVFLENTSIFYLFMDFLKLLNIIPINANFIYNHF